MSALTMLVPLLLGAVAIWGSARRVDVFEALTTGAGEGIQILLRILPSLVALLTAVYMLRASGALEACAELLAPLLRLLGIPVGPLRKPYQELGGAKLEELTRLMTELGVIEKYRRS